MRMTKGQERLALLKLMEQARCEIKQALIKVPHRERLEILGEVMAAINPTGNSEITYQSVGNDNFSITMDYRKPEDRK